MTSLPHQDNLDYYAVHTGVWTNWDRGKLLGATLTTTRAQGSLLIAFISLFVTIVGTSFWRIGCFAMHYSYSAEAPRDGLYHQRQAILRNSANGAAGLWSLCQVFQAWYKTGKSPCRRILPSIALALIMLAAFAVASTFSSRISTLTGNEVLLQGSSCGKAPSSMNMSVFTTAYTIYQYRILAAGADYVQQCYLDGINRLGCGKYVRGAIPSKISWDAACPFDHKICKSQNSNLHIDSGFIDSRKDLGLNTPESERFLYRRLLHCAPLVTEGYRARTNNHKGEAMTQYLYGKQGVLSNFTYEYPTNPPSSYKPETMGFNLYTVNYNSINGSLEHYPSSLIPIKELEKKDASVFLTFLSTNGVMFIENSGDPWYSTNSPADEADILGAPTYSSDEPASPLGCVAQHQLCNPNLPRGNDCSPYFSTPDSRRYTRALWPDEADHDAMQWSYKTAVNSFDIASITMQLHATALESNAARGLLQGRIASNQWQLDVERWFNISMATIQQRYIEVATGSTDSEMRKYIVRPSDSRQKKLCKNQMILSTAYINFSVFGLASILILGGLIIVSSYTIEPLVRWIQRRRNLDVYARVEWTLNETLQLQRVAHEELGLGSWVDCDKDVPTTKGRDRLAVIDLEDMCHPKLKAPPPIFEDLLSSPEGSDSQGRMNANKTSKESGNNDETAAKCKESGDMDGSLMAGHVYYSILKRLGLKKWVSRT